MAVEKQKILFGLQGKVNFYLNASNYYKLFGSGFTSLGSTGAAEHKKQASVRWPIPGQQVGGKNSNRFCDHIKYRADLFGVCCLTLLFPLNVEYGQHSALVHAAVVMKVGDYDTGIPQQARSCRRMDIALNAVTVDTHLAILFHALVFGIVQQVGIELVLVVGRYGSDIFVQRRFFKLFIGNADTTKPTQGLGVYQVKGKLLVSEAKKEFSNGATQCVIGTHAIALVGWATFTSVQILKNTATKDRIGVNDVADDAKLFALNMVCNLGYQRHLFLAFFAHFVIGSFSIFVVILYVGDF